MIIRNEMDEFEPYVQFSGKISELSAQALFEAIRDLQERGANMVHLLINSIGGNCHEGISLYKKLTHLGVDLITYNTGSVDSAAVPIFLAGRQRFSTDEGQFLVHAPYITSDGRERLQHMVNAEEKIRFMLQKHAATIANILTSRTRITADQAQEYLTSETDIGSQEALRLGIITAIQNINIPAHAKVISLTFPGGNLNDQQYHRSGESKTTIFSWDFIVKTISTLLGRSH